MLCHPDRFAVLKGQTRQVELPYEIGRCLPSFVVNVARNVQDRTRRRSPLNFFLQAEIPGSYSILALCAYNGARRPPP